MCEDGNACLLTLSVSSVHDYLKLHSFGSIILRHTQYNSCLVWNAKVSQGQRIATCGHV